MSIPTTRLGRTGLAVSRLALGTMTFGLQTEEAVAHEILAKAASAGVNFIDTADVYPLSGGLPTAGRTEEIVGRWLKGQRESFVVATKAVGRMGPNPGTKARLANTCWKPSTLRCDACKPTMSISINCMETIPRRPWRKRWMRWMRS